jgi:hypothetical protein
LFFIGANFSGWIFPSLGMRGEDLLGILLFFWEGEIWEDRRELWWVSLSKPNMPVWIEKAGLNVPDAWDIHWTLRGSPVHSSRQQVFPRESSRCESF